MADKLEIWRWALIDLGKARIETLTDDAEAVYVFNDAWSGVVQEAFEEGDWNAFKETSSLSESGTGTATLGYDYVFDYPDDYVRTVAVSPDQYFTAPFTAYVDQDGYIHSSVNPLHLRYISNAKMGDDQIENWPRAFARYVATKLAYETCERLTNGTTLEEKLEKRVRKRLRQAKSVDARNEQGREVRNSNWLNARVGTRFSGGERMQVSGGSGSDPITLGDGDV